MKETASEILSERVLSAFRRIAQCSLTTSGSPPVFVAITGKPAAIASNAVRANGSSHKEGTTAMSAIA